MRIKDYCSTWTMLMRNSGCHYQETKTEASQSFLIIQLLWHFYLTKILFQFPFLSFPKLFRILILNRTMSMMNSIHTILKVKFLSKNFTSFLPKFFLTIFLVKSKLSTAKKSKPPTFSRVFHSIKVEFLDSVNSIK